MITFYGYAVRKEGKYIGFKPKIGKSIVKYYKRPRLPYVGYKDYVAQDYADKHRGEVVKVKLTMEEVKEW